MVMGPCPYKVYTQWRITDGPQNLTKMCGSIDLPGMQKYTTLIQIINMSWLTQFSLYFVYYVFFFSSPPPLHIFIFIIVQPGRVLIGILGRTGLFPERFCFGLNKNKKTTKKNKESRVRTPHLTPEDPERATDDDGGGQDDVDQQRSGDDRVLGAARGLFDHVMVHRLHPETGTKQGDIL